MAEKPQWLAIDILLPLNSIIIRDAIKRLRAEAKRFGVKLVQGTRKKHLDANPPYMTVLFLCRPNGEGSY